MPMNAGKNECEARLKSKPWTEWSEDESAYFRKKQEAEPSDPVFAERYA